MLDIAAQIMNGIVLGMALGLLLAVQILCFV